MPSKEWDAAFGDKERESKKKKKKKGFSIPKAKRPGEGRARRAERSVRMMF